MSLLMTFNCLAHGGSTASEGIAWRGQARHCGADERLGECALIQKAGVQNSLADDSLEHGVGAVKAAEPGEVTLEMSQSAGLLGAS